MPDSNDNADLERKAGVDHPRWDFQRCLKCGDLNVYAKCRYSCPHR